MNKIINGWETCKPNAQGLYAFHGLSYLDQEFNLVPLILLSNITHNFKFKEDFNLDLNKEPTVLVTHPYNSDLGNNELTDDDSIAEKIEIFTPTVSGSPSNIYIDKFNTSFVQSANKLLQNCVDKFPLPHANFAVMLNGVPVDLNATLADAGLTDGCQVDLVSLE